MGLRQIGRGVLVMFLGVVIAISPIWIALAWYPGGGARQVDLLRYSDSPAYSLTATKNVYNIVQLDGPPLDLESISVVRRVNEAPPGSEVAKLGPSVPLEVEPGWGDTDIGPSVAVFRTKEGTELYEIDVPSEVDITLVSGDIKRDQMLNVVSWVGLIVGAGLVVFGLQIATRPISSTKRTA